MPTPRKSPVKPKRPRGRPPTPDATIDRLMRAVCERVAKGELVKYAAQAEGTYASQIREWGLTSDYAALYARAREQQAHALAEQAIEIADGEDGLTALYDDAIEAEEERIEGLESEAAKSRALKALSSLRANIVTRDRMRLDARKWLTSKIAPKLYGEKLDLTSGGKEMKGLTWTFGDRTVEF